MDSLPKWEAVTFDPAIQNAVTSSGACDSVQLLHTCHCCLSKILCSLSLGISAIFSVTNVTDNAMQISTPIWGLY